MSDLFLSSLVLGGDVGVGSEKEEETECVVREKRSATDNVSLPEVTALTPRRGEQKAVANAAGLNK